MAGDTSKDSDPRRSEADPAAELRARSRRRLIGAAVLLLAAVILLPVLLDTAPRPVREDITFAVRNPPPAAAEKSAEPAPLPARPAEVEPAPAETKTRPAEPKAVPPEPKATTAETKSASAEAKSTPADTSAAKVPPPASAAPVAKTPAAEKPTQPAPAATTGKVVIQVAALSSPAAAEEMMIGLIKSGFDAYVEPISTSSGTMHRVRVGPYASRNDAQRAVERLKAAGHKATVVGG